MLAGTRAYSTIRRWYCAAGPVDTRLRQRIPGTGRDAATSEIRRRQVLKLFRPAMKQQRRSGAESPTPGFLEYFGVFFFVERTQVLRLKEPRQRTTNRHQEGNEHREQQAERTRLEYP